MDPNTDDIDLVEEEEEHHPSNRGEDTCIIGESREILSLIIWWFVSIYLLSRSSSENKRGCGRVRDLLWMGNVW